MEIFRITIKNSKPDEFAIICIDSRFCVTENEFLDVIAKIEGITHVNGRDKYHLCLHIADMFKPIEVSEKIRKVISLYAEERGLLSGLKFSEEKTKANVSDFLSYEYPGRGMLDRIMDEIEKEEQLKKSKTNLNLKFKDKTNSQIFNMRRMAVGEEDYENAAIFQKELIARGVAKEPED